VLKSYFYKVREDCWELINNTYPEEKSKYALSREIVERSIKEYNVSEKILVLDAGCGHKSKVSSHPNVFYIGTDIVFGDVSRNKDVDYRFVSNLDKIPLKRNSVDIVFSNMVLEHLEDPANFFSDVYQILKPGGYLIFSTPCIYNIVVVVNRLLPDTLSKKLGAVLTNIEEDDIFPTVYRANSISKVRKFYREHNFKEIDLIMYQPPPYAFVFSRIICYLVIYYYKIINKYDALSFLRGIIIARCQKTTPNSGVMDPQI